MEYCCHVWAGAPSCCLEFLDKLQKQICRSLAASLEPLAHCRNVASLSLFSIGIILVDVHLNWLNWFHLLILKGVLLVMLIECIIFVSPFLGCYKDVYVNSFFLRTTRLWNSLPVECFPLTYDLGDFKSRINRYLLTVGSF